MLNARLGTGRAWLSTRLEQTKITAARGGYGNRTASYKAGNPLPSKPDSKYPKAHSSGQKAIMLPASLPAAGLSP